MRRALLLLAFISFVACNRNQQDSGKKVITVSIAPFKYFVEAVAGNDFRVNVMVPAGSNPHIYEPYPRQITSLRASAAYIANGCLGFETTWLDRFYEVNRKMQKLTISDRIDLISTGHHHEGEGAESADPHYWVSPKSAMIIAGSVKDLLCNLNPAGRDKYEAGYSSLMEKIREEDRKASEYFAGYAGGSFMIYHPNLAYLARDYGLNEIPVEFEGKEPPPSRLKDLIDLAGKEHLKTIFVQREYDSKNAAEIAREIGAKVRIIDPLSENWLDTTRDIIDALHTSLVESKLN